MMPSLQMKNPGLGTVPELAQRHAGAGLEPRSLTPETLLAKA